MLKLKLLSSLAKVYTDMPLNTEHCINSATMLQNDKYHFQLAYITNVNQNGRSVPVSFKCESELGDALTVRFVEGVPCDVTTRTDAIDMMEHPDTGVLPDILADVPPLIWSYCDKWRSFWITVDTVNFDVNPGKYDIKFTMSDNKPNFNENTVSTTFTIEVLDAKMPENSFPVTNWFHCDAICNYYKVDFLSDEFWRITENFVKTSVENNSNMILTPVFTPPLDTEVGGERLTTQLVDVTVTNGEYSFGFDNLDKWVAMCKHCGVKYYEISHLFTQWGCKHAPKVMATVDGEYKRIFGWETDGHGKEYIDFIEKFLLALTERLKALDIYDVSYFHISDEPKLDVIEDYKLGFEAVSKYIPKTKIIDALSDLDFYKQGVIQVPVPSLNHLQGFYDEKVEHLWGYYCSSQSTTSNRYIAAPSNVNRMLGTVLFRYNLKGFLHWGYNFYNSCKSLFTVDPYSTASGAGWVPAGDTYVVYPKADGTAIESLRLCVLSDAMRDRLLLEKVSEKIGFEKTLEEFGLKEIDCFTFLSANQILVQREKLNKMYLELSK